MRIRANLGYYNRMQNQTDVDGYDTTYDNVEDVIRGEQHRLNLVNQVISEDMKHERRIYGNVIPRDNI